MLRYCWNQKITPRNRQKRTMESENEFERRFRIPRDVVLGIVDASVVGDGECCEFSRWGLRKENIRSREISILENVIARHRQLSYGKQSDFGDHAFKINGKPDFPFLIVLTSLDCSQHNNLVFFHSCLYFYI